VRSILSRPQAVSKGAGGRDMAIAWIYILHCADGSYDTGHTTHLERRLAEHQAGEGSDWTKSRLPVELVFAQ